MVKVGAPLTFNTFNFPISIIIRIFTLKLREIN